MEKRIERLRNLRRRKRKRPTCPTCNTPMKRKGRGSSRYWKCPVCGTKILSDGSVKVKTFGDDKVAHDAQVKLGRREMAKRKFIKWAKRQKYYPLRVIEWSGEIIDLKEYDKDGISLEEKERQKKLEEKVKKQEEELEKREMESGKDV